MADDWQSIQNIVYAERGNYKMYCTLGGVYKITKERRVVYAKKGITDAVEMFNQLINK